MDIDKLYLSTLSYNFSDKVDVEGDIKNKILKDWISLLCQAGKQVYVDETQEGQKLAFGKYIHMLQRSIDNDTEIVKRILENIEGNKSSKEEPMQFGSLGTQVDIKDSFLTGKFGIAPFALNNNSQILTLLYKVGFEKFSGKILTELGRTSLHDYTDRNGNNILSWLSALINAHVDVAKDPWILRLNVNQYTWNLLNLLVRTGFGNDSIYYINQPIFKELAVLYINTNGTIVDDPGLSPTERWRKAVLEYLLTVDFGFQNNQMIQAMFNPKTTKKEKQAQHDINMPIYKALFSVDKNGKYTGKKSPLEIVLTDPNMRKNPNKPVSLDNLINDKDLVQVGDVKMTPLEVLMYAMMAKLLFDEYADALSDLVRLTKIDTKKQGISYQEQQNYKEEYDELHDQAVARSRGYDSKSLFDENLIHMLDDSFIHTKTENAIPLLEEMLGDELIHFTRSFRTAVSMICNRLNNRKTDTKIAAQRAILTYIKLKCMNKYMSENNISFLDMVTGNNTLINRIIVLRNKMLSDRTGKYSDFVTNGDFTNILLSNLSKVPYIVPYGQQKYDIIGLDIMDNDDTDIKDMYISDWLQLWESDDEEIKQIAHDLAIYAFMTSGDTMGFTKFFKYVPLSIRDAIGYTESMEQVKQLFTSGSITFHETFGEDTDLNNIDINEVIRNNWRNNNIIPQFDVREFYFDIFERMYSYRSRVTGTYLTYLDVDTNGQLVEKHDVYKIFGGVVRTSKGKWYRTISPSRTGEFPPYVKVRRTGISYLDADSYQLYKLVGVGIKHTTDKKGVLYSMEYPIYAITYPKGFEIRSGSQTYTFYENARNDDYDHIFDREYFLSDDYRDWLEKLMAIIGTFISDPTQGEIDIQAVREAISDEYGELLSIDETELLVDMYQHGGYEAYKYTSLDVEEDNGTDVFGIENPERSSEGENRSNNNQTNFNNKKEFPTDEMEHCKHQNDQL